TRQRHLRQGAEVAALKLRAKAALEVVRPGSRIGRIKPPGAEREAPADHRAIAGRRSTATQSRQQAERGAEHALFLKLPHRTIHDERDGSAHAVRTLAASLHDPRAATVARIASDKPL